MCPTLSDASAQEAPLCLAPLLEMDAATFDIPPGACDTHAHVVAADAAAYPLVPERTYTPPPAPESAYLGMLKQTGMARGVLVQISVYGTDNRYMLEVLRRHPDQLRGIGVVAPTVTDSELADMHAAGVRGLRINVLFGGGIGFDAMETLAHRIAGLGWHMQFLMDARQLPELLPRMRKLPVPGVVDHMGHMPVAEEWAAPASRPCSIWSGTMAGGSSCPAPTASATASTISATWCPGHRR